MKEIQGEDSGICQGHSRSMHTIKRSARFYSSAIVGGCVAIACGVALSLKLKGSKQKVWCFVGDGATDTGWFYEALRYAVANDLPITYIIEDNNRSVCSTRQQRWGSKDVYDWTGIPKVIYYEYLPKWPHVGFGKWITF